MQGLDINQLYGTELPYVYSFLYRLGCRNTELEDLAHDVFVTAMRRSSTYDPSRPVRPWLLGIAFRVVADARRRPSAQRERLEVPSEDVAYEGEDADERLAQRDRRALIDEALTSLDADRRAVFVMYELEGIPAAEIAEAMGTPVATTYSRLRVGREEFTAAVRRIQLRRGER
ncbi:MAG: RNA polymerase sigma factor [Myxococcaceae bacterium]|nr:RNA polymerase sigma factor [Myxococcaceae bacterium]